MKCSSLYHFDELDQNTIIWLQRYCYHSKRSKSTTILGLELHRVAAMAEGVQNFKSNLQCTKCVLYIFLMERLRPELISDDSAIRSMPAIARMYLKNVQQETARKSKLKQDNECRWSQEKEPASQGRGVTWSYLTEYGLGESGKCLLFGDSVIETLLPSTSWWKDKHHCFGHSKFADELLFQWRDELNSLSDYN